MQEQQQAQKPVLAASPREYILRYVRYLPLIIISVALALGIAWIKLRYSVPYYKAQGAMLLRESKTTSGDDKLEDLLQNRQGVNIRNEIEVMQSSLLAKRVVKALNLQVQYYNLGKVRNSLLYKNSPFSLDILRWKDSSKPFSFSIVIKDANRFSFVNENRTYLFGETFVFEGNQMRLLLTGSSDPNAYDSKEFSVSWMPADYAIGLVNGQLNVAIVNNNTSILNLTLLSEHPQMAADIIDQLMKEYNKSNIEEKNQTAVNTLQFIDESLDTIKAELSGIERTIQQFSERNKAMSLDIQAQTYLENLAAGDNKIVEQQVRLRVVNYMIHYLDRSENSYKLVPNVLDVAEPTLLPLINNYNQLQLERQTKLQTMPPGNQIIKNIEINVEKLRQDIVENLNNVKKSYEITLTGAQEKSKKMEGELLSLPGKGKQLAEISRQQKILEDLYKFLLTRKIETSISSASIISNSRVLEGATVSLIPVKPDKKATYFIAFFLGLVIPIALIYVKEYFNDKIESRAELEKLTIVPLIGEVGHIVGGETLVAKPGNRSYVAEQFRIVRTNLQFVLNKVERPVILVTSSFSGEGKSFVSTNMGSVMAMAGKSTVILELDIRKPKVTAGLDLSNRKGITNYMVTNLDPDELPVAVPGIENLYVIPCGPLPPNPAELLMDEKLNDLIMWAKERFEVVIMDSAPVGLVSDAAILNRFADCTLYLVRQQYTFKKQVEFINKIYDDKKLNNLFILLNDVKVQKGYGYAYNYGYGYGHHNGYFDDMNKKRRWLNSNKKGK